MGRENSAKQRLGLINSHVLLRDHFESHADSSEGPFPPNHLLQIGLGVVSPSDYDHAYALKALSKISTEAENTHADKLTQYGDMDLSQEQKDFLDHLKMKAVVARNTERFAKTYDRIVGPVFAASGITTTKFNPTNSSVKISPDSNWALDWALFSIDQPTHRSDVSRHKLMQWERIRPHERYEVRTQGRTSGKAYGLISPVKSTVNTSGIKPTTSEEYPNIHQGILINQYQGTPVTAHCLVSRKKDDWIEFIRPGDSGSLIIADYNDDAEPTDRIVYGLAFASNDGTLVSYMIPAELLVEDIARVTGGGNVRFLG